ncbi:DUF2510 domain-containing protein [Streptomyces boluensis]|uniref:DUF2510 domain-containing protein n=1 Tax=Streptomyces boluensis TaxID=1775135 RepID=A0A964XR13_9ACTN|nr:DUF2510 domain-containing protein [Streptomyces boluensis]NBE56886.1 DUF2510 domain-containing protein [Streptomyces boluensis]
MSMTTPPGWYPDPAAPALERWWDGASWTEHTRAAGGVPGVPVAVPGGYPQTAARPGEASRRAKAVALAAAGLVLATAIVTGAVVLGREGGTPDARNPGPSATATGPESEEPTPTATPTATSGTSAPAADETVLTDQLNGISVPIPDGWQRAERATDRVPTAVTEETYTCPGTSALCHPGRVSTHSVSAGSSDVRNVAEKDIAVAAERAYDRDIGRRRPYNGMTSHREVATGKAQVAGADAYFVRWRVTTASGPGGYVQTLALPAPAGGPGSMVVVRFAFDAGPEGPPLAAIDEITRGIRSLR